MEKTMAAHGGPDAWYSALKAKDARFDGRFFVAVSSTGIYCRPICTAKLPRPENCSFHRTAASAEQAGYRPRSEEHTSELQSLMRISYAVFCLKKKKHVL